MDGLDLFFAQQRVLVQQYRGFLASLEASRTATLLQLVSRPELSLSRLQAEWIDLDLFLLRLSAMGRFFNSIAPNPRIRGYAGGPLIFFQASPPEEDAVEHRRRCEMPSFGGFYSESFGDLPPEVHYLHLETSWMGYLLGTWRSRARRITPLNPFTSRGSIGIDQYGRGWRNKPMILGLRLPDYPQLLGVQDDTATDYLARIIIHDIGHGFLPKTPSEREALHNVVMIHAMEVQDRPSNRTPWEDLIRRECTHPYFFLEAKDLITHCEEMASELKLTALQRFLLERFRRLYAKSSPNRRRQLWGVETTATPAEQRQQVRNTIGEMCATGFAGYG